MISNRYTAELVENAFREAGLNVLADYRQEEEEIKIREAFEDGISFIVVMTLFDWVPAYFSVDRVRGRRNWLEKMKVKVFTAGDQTVKVMTVRSAIVMIKERTGGQ